MADNIAGDNFDIQAAVELFVQTIDLVVPYLVAAHKDTEKMNIAAGLLDIRLDCNLVEFVLDLDC